MPLFRRSKQPAGDAVPQFESPPPALRGNLPCSSPGCPAQDSVSCSYVDRRGRPCGTAWCPAHQAVVGGAAYCRRHARQHGAVPAGSFLADRGLPDVDNRAPSLVNWMGDALEVSILQLLASLRRPGTADDVGTEPVHLVRPPDGGRRWDRTWKLFDHTGSLCKVTISVEEERDPEVDVYVGRVLVVRQVPPWIVRRKAGKPALDDEADRTEREGFYRAIYERIVPEAVAEVGRTR